MERAIRNNVAEILRSRTEKLGYALKKDDTF